MFTGLVQATGSVVRVADRGDLRELTFESRAVAAELSVGDSVAVSGVCLTATSVAAAAGRFQVDVAKESLDRTRLGALAVGSAVNLELPLRASDRLGGHFVQGHVDGLGELAHAGPRDGNYILRVVHPARFAHLVVEKGSIAIDGVSLTVSAVEDDVEGGGAFEVMLIPHTLGATTLGGLAAGDAVHLEYDILAKYVQRLVERESENENP